MLLWICNYQTDNKDIITNIYFTSTLFLLDLFISLDNILQMV